jgi:hypothetical protein
MSLNQNKYLNDLTKCDIKGTQVLELFVSVRLTDGLVKCLKAHVIGIFLRAEKEYNVFVLILDLRHFFGSKGHLKVSMESGRSVCDSCQIEDQVVFFTHNEGMRFCV